MDIARMSEVNQILTKEYENQLKEFMMRINNQLTFSLELGEVMVARDKEEGSEKKEDAQKEFEKKQSEHRMQHEFDIIFQQELSMHMDSVYEVALDIFCEAYSKMLTLMNFNELFLNEVQRLNVQVYDNFWDRSDLVYFMKRIRLNITKIIAERHINRYVSYNDLEYLFNQVSKNFFIELGLIDVGTIFELRSG